LSFGGGDTNLYRYVQANPVNWIDPDGLQQRSPHGEITAPSSLPKRALDYVYTDFKNFVNPSHPNGRVDVCMKYMPLLVSGGEAAIGSQCAAKGPVVIGETMSRVEMAASKFPGSKILNDMPDFSAMGLKAHEVTSQMMQYNRRWILEQLRSGRTIIDIGRDINRAIPSIFYQMEQSMIRNYNKLHP